MQISQTQPVVTTRAIGLKPGLCNRDNFFGERTILRSTICILPTLHYKTSIKTRLKNVEHYQQGCQKENRVGLDKQNHLLIGSSLIKYTRMVDWNGNNLRLT